MTPACDPWTAQLANVITATLTELHGRVPDQIEMFAVDCSPWSGFLALAFLTRAEVVHDPLLCDPAEMAAWTLNDFGSGLVSWGQP